MLQILAILSCLLLIGLGVFQFMIARGKPWGEYAWGGQQKVLSKKLQRGSYLSILLYAVFIVIILDAADILSIAQDSNIGIWLLTIYFFFGSVMNLVSRSKKERMVMTPITLFLAVSCLLLAIG